MSKGKAFGYNCEICGRPIYDSESTAHTDDGLAHEFCCSAAPDSSVPTTAPAAATENQKLREVLREHKEWMEENGLRSDGVPIHDCEFELDPEQGHCSFHELYAKTVAALDLGSETQMPMGVASKQTGVDLIAAERRRQVEQEGWSAEHDKSHDKGELAKAALCYAYHATYSGYGPLTWPWDDKYWKPGVGRTPHTRIRALVKAGALIAAEIDRLRVSLTSSDSTKSVVSREKENQPAPRPMEQQRKEAGL